MGIWCCRIATVQMETTTDKRVSCRDPEGLMWRPLGKSKKTNNKKIIEIVIIALS